MGRKVVLVYTNRTIPPVAPLSLDYLACSLQRNGFQVDILDLCLADDFPEAIGEYFARNEVFAVGVNLRNIDDMSLASPTFFTPQYKVMIDLIRSVISAPLILGGPGFSLLPEVTLDYCNVNLGIRSEGEHSLPLLLTKIQSGDDLRDVPGLVYRVDGKFQRDKPSRAHPSNHPLIGF